MRKIIGAVTLVVALFCFVFAGATAANLVDGYDEEFADWVFVVAAVVPLAVGLACLRLSVVSLRRPRA